MGPVEETASAIDSVGGVPTNGPDYGYLFWLNTKQKQWPSGPVASFAAVGNGGNIVWSDPDHDIVADMALSTNPARRWMRTTCAPT